MYSSCPTSPLMNRSSSSGLTNPDCNLCIPERTRESLSFGALAAHRPNRVPVKSLISRGPMILTLDLEILRPWLCRVLALIGISCRAAAPENARSSIHVEYATDLASHACRISPSTIQIVRFANSGLVAAPCGRCRSKVVSLVSRAATLVEHPKNSRHTRYMWRFVMLGKQDFTSIVTSTEAFRCSCALSITLRFGTAPTTLLGKQIGRRRMR